jgi:thiol-disulfide isomerase/thioredoxin
MTETHSPNQAPAQSLRRRVAAGALAALAVVAPRLAGAQVPADAVLRAFQPTSEFRLHVAGKEVPAAEIYDSQVAGALLIVSSSLSSPVILHKRGGEVGTVHVMKVAKRPDGSVDLLADAEVADLGRFRLEGEEVIFRVDGKEARLKPNPPLVGLHPRSELVAHSPEYLKDAGAYSPDPASMEKLRKVGQPAVVRVFFGSWCSFCKRHLPYLVKVEAGLSGSQVAFEYYGLPRPPWNDSEAARFGVKGVPTGIVLVAGREVGRIEGNDWARPETTLASVLEKARSAS